METVYNYVINVLTPPPSCYNLPWATLQETLVEGLQVRDCILLVLLLCSFIYPRSYGIPVQQGLANYLLLRSCWYNTFTIYALYNSFLWNAPVLYYIAYMVNSCNVHLQVSKWLICI